jgi:hypothetical protein
MIKPLNTTLAGFFLIMIAQSCVRANQVGYSVNDLIKLADVIVIGTAQSVSKTPALESYGTKVLSISFTVSECLKKNNGPIIQIGNTLKLLNAVGGPERPVITEGKRYILFLQQSEVGPYPLGSLSGVLPITDNDVQTPFVVGEPAEQDLNSLKNRILLNTKGFGCKDTWESPKNP